MKLGLGEPYDKVTILPLKIRAYIDLTKPASSVGVGLAYFLGSLLFFAYAGGRGSVWQAQEQLVSIIYVSVTMFLAHSASQTINMSEDAEMDSETPHKQNRPIPSGIVSADEARALATILAVFALGRAYLVNWTFGAVATVLIFMGIFYSLPPLRVKQTIFSIPWQAASRGLLLFPAVWAAYGNILSPTPWVLGAFAFFYVMGFQNSADIIDREVDEEYGIRTFIVEFGVENTMLIAAGCTLMMVAVLSTGLLSGLVPLSSIALIAIIPFCLYMLYQMWENPYKVSERTGNHPAWLWFYIGMVLMVVLPLGSEVIYA